MILLFSRFMLITEGLLRQSRNIIPSQIFYNHSKSSSWGDPAYSMTYKLSWLESKAKKNKITNLVLMWVGYLHSIPRPYSLGWLYHKVRYYYENVWVREYQQVHPTMRKTTLVHALLLGGGGGRTYITRIGNQISNIQIKRRHVYSSYLLLRIPFLFISKQPHFHCFLFSSDCLLSSKLFQTQSL